MNDYCPHCRKLVHLLIRSTTQREGDGALWSHTTFTCEQCNATVRIETSPVIGTEEKP